MESGQVAIAEPVAWAMLARASRILVGRGSKVEVFYPSKTTRSEIVARVMGRSGNLRAPGLRIGSEFLIGYSAGGTGAS